MRAVNSGRGTRRLDQSQYLPRLSVAAEHLLGENDPAVHVHLEYAARGLDELDLGVRVRLTNLGRQTGSPGFVVSDDAEFDGNAHAVG